MSILTNSEGKKFAFPLWLSLSPFDETIEPLAGNVEGRQRSTIVYSVSYGIDLSEINERTIICYDFKFNRKTT